jgi:hypothetical protein
MLGYSMFGTIEDHPPGHRRIFLKQTFDTQSGVGA